jgi:LytR cell envelope-related transcriptional attenuator
MQAIPYALSVHHFISSVGADAGFAAFVAVALLVLLYFSQARETSNLRRRADEAGQRVEELEGRLYELSEQISALPAEISVRAAVPRTAGAHGYVPAPAPAGVGGVGVTMPPAAPAGVGAPSLAAATRLIPDPIAAIGEREPATVGLVDRPDDQATEAHPAPAALVGGNGSSNRPVAAPAATMQRTVPPRSGGPSRPGGPPPRGGQGRPGAVQGRPGGPPRTALAGRPGPRRTGPGRVLTVFAVLLLVGAVVAGVIVIRNIHKSSNESKTTAATARSTLAKGRTTPVAVVKPATVIVSVLNGTDQSGLAASVSNQLTSAGYKKGAVTNAADQTHTTTLIQYLPRDKPDAEAVARSLKLGLSTVQPIDSATQRIVCSASPVGCSSPVIVTVGSNLATQ